MANQTAVDNIKTIVDNYVSSGEANTLKQFETAIENAYDMDWEAFKALFNSYFAQVYIVDAIRRFPRVSASDIRSRIDNVALLINRMQVERYAMMFLETGITNYYGEFDRESTTLSNDEWLQLGAALQAKIASATDQQLLQRFPNRQPTVIRNRFDNIARFIAQQQLQRDAGTLVAYREPQYVLDEEEGKANQPRRPILRVKRLEEQEGLAPLTIALITIASIVAAVLLAMLALFLYQKIQLRRRKNAAHAHAHALAPEQNAAPPDIGTRA